MREKAIQENLKAVGSERGFSMVELMVALALTGLVSVAIYKTLKSQQTVYIGQDQIVNVQQDVRASADVMMRQMRMAGFDPSNSSGIGFMTATASTVRFTADLDSDGDIASDPNEDVTYGRTGGALGVGFAGASTLQVLVPNISMLDFAYFDAAGNVLTTPVAVSDLDKIRSVQISLIVRSSKMDRDYTDNNNYIIQRGATTSSVTLLSSPGDHFRRRLLSTTVNCRNMGLSE